MAALLTAALSACASRDGATDGGVDGGLDAIVVRDALGDEPMAWLLDFVPRDRTVFDVPPPRESDAPRCRSANVARCACFNGASGLQVCEDDGTWAPCQCARRTPPTPHPPRLVAPIHARMVSSQRPTLRWALPPDVTRARVELCDDRACARRITQAEVSASAWRPTERLRPGVVFWRVTGLRADGSSAWTSATWEFGVRHRDSEVDTTLGTFKDFNGDTYDDLVVVSFAGVEGRPLPVRFEVFPGGAGGVSMSRRLTVRSTRPSTVHSLPITVATGDINGDGLADLLTATNDERDVQVFYGSRSDVLRSGPFLMGGGATNLPTGAALGDFNGDGFDDAFFGLGTPGGCPAALHLGGADGVPTTPSTTGSLDCEDGRASSSIATPIAAGDVGSDGYTDFFTWVPRVLTLFHGNPAGTLTQRDPDLRTLTYLGARGMWAADVNADGATDVFVAPPANVLYSHGGTLSARSSRYAYDPPPGWTIAHTAGRPGDFDGDGRLDFPLIEYCDELVAADAGVRETCRYGHLVVHQSDADGVNRDVVGRVDQVAAWSAFASPGDLDADGFDELALERDDRVLLLRFGGRGAWETRGSVASVEGGVQVVH